MRGHSVIYIAKKKSAFYPVNYGILYNWYAINDSRSICSSGFHVPAYTELTTLATYLGGTSIAGGKLKETGFAYWDSPNTGATNEVAFNLRGSGNRNHSTGVFSSIGIETRLWTSYDGGTIGLQYSASKDNALFGLLNNNKKTGYSIRIVRDATTPELSLPDGLISATYVGNDLKAYRLCKVGTQIWTADCLAETRFANGDWIHGYDGGTYTPISNAAWTVLTTEGCCAYADNLANV